jgi:hypothetical protein
LFDVVFDFALPSPSPSPTVLLRNLFVMACRRVPSGVTILNLCLFWRGVLPGLQRSASHRYSSLRSHMHLYFTCTFQQGNGDGGERGGGGGRGISLDEIDVLLQRQDDGLQHEWILEAAIPIRNGLSNAQRPGGHQVLPFCFGWGQVELHEYDRVCFSKSLS